MKHIKTPTGAVAAYEGKSSEQPLFFQDLAKREVVGHFEGGHVSSDAGGLLVSELDRKDGYLERFAHCFSDHRDPKLVEHSVVELLRQRVYGVVQGYEDLNDHERLRLDPLFAAMCGKSDLLGESRQREEDRGKALAGKSTLNRLELTPGDADASHRYKKIVAQEEKLEAYFINEFVRSLSLESKEVILDLDATDDPIHGEQEGRFFHGYYGHYCYLPLYIFCGDWPVVAKLRCSKIDASQGSLEMIQKVVAALRERFAGLKIILRADSGFCRDRIMTWCELHGVYYLFGLARNRVLESKLKEFMEKAKTQSEANAGESARVFRGFVYRPPSWMALRWVVGKAEWTRGEANPRFVVTNLNPLEFKEQDLYEKTYCARGNMENRIKEQQLDLFADRTSAETMRANQLRLWFSTLAYLLLNQLRRVGLQGTQLAKATCATIRTRLLKIGALIRVTVRRVWVSMSSAFPLQELFALTLQRLRSQSETG